MKLLPATILALCVGFPSIDRAEPPAPAAPDAGSYRLYLGTDLSLKYHGEFLRVEGLKRDALIVRVNNQPVSVPMSRAMGQLKFERAMKLSARSATVAQLNYARVYTAATDPALKFDHVQEALDGMVNEAATAEGSVGVAAGQVMMANKGSVSPASEGGQLIRNAQATADSIGRQSDSLQSMDTSANVLNEDLPDAIKGSFAVSSETPLENAYAMAIVRFRDPRDPPRRVKDWISVIPLDRVIAQARTYEFSGAGFPGGYQIVNFELHLYDAGREVATNVAPRQITLAPKTAYRYMIFDYLSAHKGATLPAALAPAELSTESWAGIPASELALTYYVRVGKDGAATQIFLDPAGTVIPADPAIQTALKTVRFYPALVNGTPMEGSATVKPAQLRMRTSP